MGVYGLTLQQASLLIRCVRSEGSSPHELMSHLGTDKAGISRLVDRLEATSLLVRRAGGDRRSTTLEATEAGTALAPKLEKIFAGTRREILAGLAAAETAQLESLMTRILTNIRRLEHQ
jgi:DNA-binding MarR family transcriptional regulator